jgi:hypothetical protein
MLKTHLTDLAMLHLCRLTGKRGASAGQAVAVGRQDDAAFSGHLGVGSMNREQAASPDR